MYQQLVQSALNRCFGIITDPEKLYLIQSCSIGDIINLGGYTRTLLNKTHKKSAMMIAQQRYEPINIDFDGISEIKYLNHVEFVAPRANTPMFPPSFIFWQNLVENLRQKGYIIYAT